MNRLRLALAAPVLAVSLAVASCGAPPWGPLDCTVIIGQPGTMGLPTYQGPWAPLSLNNWPMTDWFQHCQGHFKVAKMGHDGPLPNGDGGWVVPLVLDLAGCMFHTDVLILAERTYWELATLDPNYAFNN